PQRFQFFRRAASSARRTASAVGILVSDMEYQCRFRVTDWSLFARSTQRLTPRASAPTSHAPGQGPQEQATPNANGAIQLAPHNRKLDIDTGDMNQAVGLQ